MLFKSKKDQKIEVLETALYDAYKTIGEQTELLAAANQHRVALINYILEIQPLLTKKQQTELFSKYLEGIHNEMIENAVDNETNNERND